MPVDPLASLPDQSFIIIDANVLIYALSGLSGDCQRLIERCSREEVTGIILLETVNEVTHRLMVAEAVSKGLTAKDSVRGLKKNFEVVVTLKDYWKEIE